MRLIDVEAVLNEGDPERVVELPLRLVLQARRLQQLYERHDDIDVFQHLQALVESLATCGDAIEWRPKGETGYWNPEEDEDEEVEVGSTAALPQEAPATTEEPANPDSGSSDGGSDSDGGSAEPEKALRFFAWKSVSFGVGIASSPADRQRMLHTLRIQTSSIDIAGMSGMGGVCILRQSDADTPTETILHTLQQMRELGVPMDTRTLMALVTSALEGLCVPMPTAFEVDAIVAEYLRQTVAAADKANAEPTCYVVLTDDPQAETPLQGVYATEEAASQHVAALGGRVDSDVVQRDFKCRVAPEQGE